MALSPQQALQRAEATEQKLIARLNAANLEAATPGSTSDPAQLPSLREALAAIQVEKAEIAKAVLQETQASAASAPTAPAPPPGSGLAAQGEQPDPRALEAQASQEAAVLRQKMTAEPEFAGGVLSGLLGLSKSRSPRDLAGPAPAGGDPLSARTTSGKAVQPQAAPQAGAQKPSVEDPLAIQDLGPAPEEPLVKAGQAPEAPFPSAPAPNPLLGPITQKAIAEAAAPRAQRAAEEAGTAEIPRISDTPDMDALREMLGRNPDGVPTKPEGFTRAQRLAAGFLAAAAPALHAAIVNPEVARRQRAAETATALKAREQGKEQAGQIVLAQLEGARQGRESAERIAAGKLAKQNFERTVMSQAALLALIPRADSLVKQSDAVLAELRGPGADQGQRAYATALEAQKKSIDSLLEPFSKNPELLTPQTVNIVHQAILAFERNLSTSVRAAATAAKIPTTVIKEYQASREIFVTAKQALKILNNGMGLFGTAPGGAVEAKLFQKLQPDSFKALDPLLSRITGIFTSEAGGKNLSLIESKLFGGQFTMVTDDPSVTYFKLVNALSVFGRKILSLEAIHGGPQNFGDFESIVFKDPLPEQAYENLRDAGVTGAGAFGGAQAEQPSGGFKPPETHTDTGYVLESE